MKSGLVIFVFAIIGFMSWRVTRDAYVPNRESVQVTEVSVTPSPVRQGKKAKVKMRIENHSSEPMKLFEVRQSCSCLELESHGSDVILSGHILDIFGTIRANSPREIASSNVVITLQSTRENREPIFLRSAVSVPVIANVEVEPLALDFGEIEKGKNSRRKIVFQFAETSAEPKLLDMNDESGIVPFRFSVPVQTGPNRIEVEVIFDSNEISEKQSSYAMVARFSAVSDSTDQISIPIRAYVKTNVVFRPNRIFLSDASPVQTLMLQYSNPSQQLPDFLFDPTELSVIRAVCSAPGVFEITIGRPQNSTSGEFSLTCSVLGQDSLVIPVIVER
ncbi:MAG: hypothetical protein KDB03_17360 [Planctomycetales bacterium]|nr:hypothetical protein [Planctomycetales bacterium]